MSKLQDGVGARREYLGDDHEEYWFHCPGCGHPHAIQVRWGSKTTRAKSQEPKWSFNGDHEKPTFTPSLLNNVGGANPAVPVCHLFITDGVIRFLPDCTHHLKGQNVPMLDVY